MALSIENNELKQFIEENINLIDENKWDEVYGIASYAYCTEENPDGITSLLTNILLECGINPLLYMDRIPSAYYCNNEIEEFIVPDTIKSITYGTLNLYNCKKFYLPKSLKYLNLQVFNYVGGDNSLVVFYNGDKETLRDSIIDPYSIDGSFTLRKSKFTIKCNDGVLEYEPNPMGNDEWWFDLPF